MQTDTFALLRLCELSETLKDERYEKSILGPGVVGDTSQKGNWTCFRNEMYNNEYVKIDSEFARTLPKSGIVRFDFSSIHRPDRLEVQLSDVKIVKFMVYNKLISVSQQVIAT